MIILIEPEAKMSLKVVGINNLSRGINGLATDISNLVDTHINNNDLTLAEVVGVLEIIKQDIITEFNNNMEDHTN